MGHDLVALVDMDGTVADFDGTMIRELRRIAAPGEPDPIGPDGKYIDAPHIRARRKLIRSQPGFWRSLPAYKIGLFKEWRQKYRIASKKAGASKPLFQEYDPDGGKGVKP